jgi:MFS family permease
VLTAFLLSSSVATPIGGRLGDSFGKRRVLVLSLAAFAVGSLLAATATSIWVMIAGRAIQGLGGGTVPLTFAIIRDQLAPRRVPRSIAFNSSLMAVGFATGIAISGPIADVIGLHGLFLVPAVVSAGTAAVAWYVVPESPIRSRDRFNSLSAGLLAAWLVALLVCVTKASTWGWASVRVLGLLGVATALVVAWAWVELRASSPLVNLRLMSRRGVWTANLVALLIGMTLFGSFGYLPQFTQTPTATGYGFGASVAHAGLVLLPAAVAQFTGGMTAARLAGTRVGFRPLIVVGCALTAASLVWITVSHTAEWQVFAASALTGLGSGLVFASLANAVITAVPATQTGIATGTNANIRTIGGAIGVAVASTLVTLVVLPSGYPAEHGYTMAFGFLACTALLACLAALALPRTLKRTGTRGSGSAEAAVALAEA